MPRARIRRGAEQFIVGKAGLAGEEDVEVAGVTQLAGEPAEFVAQRLVILAAGGRPEQRKSRAQPAQRNPCLVQRIGVASTEQDDFVEPIVTQARMGDGAKRVAFARGRRQRDRLGPSDPSELGLRERIAALGLGEDAEAQRHRPADLLGEIEQNLGAALLELELELDDRAPFPCRW